MRFFGNHLNCLCQWVFSLLRAEKSVTLLLGMIEPCRFVYHAVRLFRSEGDRHAMRTDGYSIYLTGLFFFNSWRITI
jgi:hypothetical protein